MTVYIDYDSEMDELEEKYRFPFDVEQLIEQVADYAFASENCPFANRSVNVLLTDNDGIHAYNKEYRDIDRETDVLSFPNLEFVEPGVFSVTKEEEADCIDPETGDLVLGDIILSVDRIREQAAEFGHSQKREMAFLVAHSCLHLSGYDHMEPEEAAVMEAKQEAILQHLGITRELTD